MICSATSMIRVDDQSLGMLVAFTLLHPHVGEVLGDLGVEAL